MIMPSYTFVSYSTGISSRGCKNCLRFVSGTDHPGIDEDKIEELITPRTKAIVVVH